MMNEDLEALVAQMHTSGILYSEAVREFKKRFIMNVLQQNKGNQCKAAKELGMHRNSLSRTIEELDLDIRQFRPETRHCREQAHRIAPAKLPTKELSPVIHRGMKVSAGQSLSQKQIAMRKRIQAQRDSFTAPWLKSGA